MSDPKKVHGMKLRNSKCECQVELKSVTKLELLHLKDSGEFLDKILWSGDHVKTGVHRIVLASLSPKLNRVMNENHDTFLPYTNKVVQMIV